MQVTGVQGLPRTVCWTLMACSIALLAVATWCFHATGCAGNAAGATVRSADLGFLGIVLGMVGIAPLPTLAAAAPGHVALRLLRGLLAWGLGMALLLGMAVLVPSAATCGVSDAPAWRAISAV